MNQKKRKTRLSVYIVEDHNDVLYYIYRAIGSKLIPFSKGLMVHFDSHPDLVVPKHLDPLKIYEKDYILNSVSIESWIMPAIYAGHIDTILWVKPPWSTQLENGMKKFKIGMDKSLDELRVSCGEAYFVSELSWSPDQELREPRDVALQVLTLAGEDEQEAVSCSEDKELHPEIKEKLKDRPYVLDIDLDFFSTRNPFYSLFTQEQFGILRQLYHYEHPQNQSDEALQLTTVRRREQLSELRSVIRGGCSSAPDTQRGALVSALLATFPDGRAPDPGLLDDAGCTCDDCDLPHHRSTPDQVRHLVAATQVFLSSLPRPALVTIARSSRDDYCPPEDVDFIQELVLQMLTELYGDCLEIDKPYERDILEDEPASKMDTGANKDSGQLSSKVDDEAGSSTKQSSVSRKDEENP